MTNKELTELDEYFCNPENVINDIYLLRNSRTISPKEFYELIEPEQENSFVLMKRIECNDGFTMSVQANSNLHCSPRITSRSFHSNIYNQYEVGYPDKPESLILDYAENKQTPIKTIYPYVPKTIIEQIIKKHGGIKHTNTNLQI